MPCYFTQGISKAYHNFYSVGDKTKHGFGSYECHYCRKFFLREYRHKKHVKNCAGIPGIVHNFNTKNLIIFQDSFNAKGDLPFVKYFDFETTAPSENIFNLEQEEMFVVSYVLIVAFYSVLKKSLAELASTLSDEEKMAVKELTEQFFNQHYYLSTVWSFLNSKKK